MTALRIQGLVFCLIACCVVLAATVYGRGNGQIELIILAVLIVLLGVPHGALDTIFAHRLYKFNTIAGWAGFVGLYVSLAAVVVGIWLLAPVLFLIGFIVISAAHFSGDPDAGAGLISRIVYGGAIVILPALLHSEETGQLLAYLIDAPTVGSLIPGVQSLAWPWSAALILTAGFESRRNWIAGLEILCVGALAVFAPPLIAFTVFFCAMHSARHILRTTIYAGRTSVAYLLVASAAPMTAVLVGAAFAWRWLGDTPIDARIIQIVFVGLAALTAPHVVLVEQVRFSNWRKGAHLG
jgi:beta-carotene 15,15'-dioxygenase